MDSNHLGANDQAFILPLDSQRRYCYHRTGATSNTPRMGILHFGNCTCDNAATLTINGNSRQIVLR
jgi:hypothetical protein